MKSEAIKSLLIMSLLCLSQGALAKDSHQHTSRAYAGSHDLHDSHRRDENHELHETHVHGAADLYLIVEGRTLLVELSSPGINFLGFETKGITEKQRQAVRALQQSLTKANELFSFKGGDCRLSKAQVDISSLLGVEGAGRESGEINEQGEHRDIKALYEYQCQQIRKLKSIAMPLMTVYPALEKLQLQWVVAGKQGAQKVESSGPVQLK